MLEFLSPGVRWNGVLLCDVLVYSRACNNKQECRCQGAKVVVARQARSIHLNYAHARIQTSDMFTFLAITSFGVVVGFAN